MKLNGLLGTGTGKLGSSVFAVSAGTQIVREYVAKISNPSTPAQVNQRARHKLMVQLSAAMSDVIVIPKEGLVSARNKYVSINSAAASATNGVATVDLPEIQISNGSLSLPALQCERVDDPAISVAFVTQVPLQVSRIVYVAYEVRYGSTLSLLDTKVVSTAGDARDFATKLASSDNDVVVYAYGIIDANAEATAKYGNYDVVSGQDIARLVANRTLNTEDYIFSKTVGIMLPRETSAEFTSVNVNGVSIASTGQTSVPYASQVAVVLNADDVDGLWAAVSYGGESYGMTQFNNGAATINVSGIGGGEDLRFYIGEYDGQDFTIYKTYGGVGSMASQGTEISSVTLGGVNVAASGSTLVGVANPLLLEVAASNVTNLQLRYTVNGNLSLSAPFNNGAASAEIPNLQIGDVVGIQIGHILNGNWIAVAIYGGTVTIAENPPVWTQLAVDNNLISASGNTSIEEGQNLAVAASATNADGKYLLIKKNGGSFESTGVVFASGSAATTINIADGDTFQFAIGTVNGGTVTALATFGGTVVGVEVPTVAITSAVFAGHALNNNYSDSNYPPSNAQASLSLDGNAPAGMYAALVQSASAPAAGVAKTAVAPTAFNGASSVQMSNINLGNGFTYYFVVGTLSGSDITPVAVWPYYVKYDGGGGDL